LNFHQSTMAAAIMPPQTTRTGQFSMLQSLSVMSINPSQGETGENQDCGLNGRPTDNEPRSPCGSAARVVARARAPSSVPGRVQLEVLPMVVPTLVNVLLALLPSVVIAAMQTTMIRASITAYSTAVGPSSRARKLTTES